MTFKKNEKGQALILIAFAAIALFAFAALAIDGSRVYSDKRHAQNAADTSVLAAALAYTRNNTLTVVGITDVAQDRATSNGYDSGDMSDVTVTVEDVPASECPGNVPGKDITVKIVSYVGTTFARVIGRTQVTNAVTATSRACGYYLAPLFHGNAIVSLNPSKDPKNCGFNSGESNAAKWKIEGSGIFSNGCANSKDADAVTFDSGKCASTVGQAYGFACTAQQNAPPFKYPESVDKIMPPNPCVSGGIGKWPAAGVSTFENGVYCISDFDPLDKKDITLNNATLYVLDTEFKLQFAGSGGFYGNATKPGGYTGSDPYTNYYLVIVRSTPPCTDFTKGDQVIEWRGNGSGTLYGTILAPSTCIDLRGNGDVNGMHTQVIGYTVSSNGNAGDKNEVYINYKEDEQRKDPIYPTISVLK